VFKVDQSSISYAFGYDHGYRDRDYRCPSKGNPHAEDDYAWGYKHGEVDRAAGRPFDARFAD
jgi:hypothetical protein